MIEATDSPDAGLPDDTGSLDDTAPLDDTGPSDDTAALDHAAGSTATEPVGEQLLEREGDIAADYLEVLLDIADLDGDIDIDVEGDRAAVSIIGEGLDGLVGPRGATLEALQELTRLAVLRETGVRSRLMLDVAGHRSHRREELAELGRAAAQRVLSSGDTEALAPMTPFERKVVHDAVATVGGVISESDGEEPDRHITLRKA